MERLRRDGYPGHRWRSYTPVFEERAIEMQESRLTLRFRSMRVFVSKVSETFGRWNLIIDIERLVLPCRTRQVQVLNPLEIAENSFLACTCNEPSAEHPGAISLYRQNETGFPSIVDS